MLETARAVFTEMQDGIVTITIDQKDSPVNVINLELIAELEGVLTALPADLRGLAIRSGKERQFVAGADLRQVLQASTPDEAAEASRRLQRTFNRLAELPYPSAAIITGPALGAGLELALACDYRVCVQSDDRTLGLPEIQLGLLPAGGGCVRLPRLIGLSRALSLIVRGQRFNPRRGKALGVVDDVVHPAVANEAAHRLLQRGKRSTPPRWSRLDTVAGRSALVRRVLYFQAARTIRRTTRGHYPAPLHALDTVRAGQEQGFGAGLAAEAVAFGELVVSATARNLIRLFFAAESLKAEQRVLEPMAHPVGKIGVVGAGFMGAGIAQVAAVAGYSVRLRDLDAQRVARGLKTAYDLTWKAARKGRFTPQAAAEIVSRLSGAPDYSGFRTADLIIEAVFEDAAVKQQVIQDLEAIVAPEAVIASNTSSLPIGALASAARHPSRVVGMHFFSPVHKMPLLEVIRQDGADPEAVATAVAAGRAMGKTVIVVGDGPGFYTTRVLAFMLQEAGLLFSQGADIETIDRSLTAFGFPVGPLALTDEVGIDVAAHIAGILHQAFPERFIESGTVPQLLADGRLGRKNGRGFYLYGRRKKRPDPAIYSLRQSQPTDLPSDLMARRMVLAFLNEAARCLEEGVIGSPRDGDIGAVLGLGFPPFLGGPFRYADSQGSAAIVQQLEQMRYAYGERFTPAAILGRMADSGARFYEDAP